MLRRRLWKSGGIFLLLLLILFAPGRRTDLVTAQGSHLWVDAVYGSDVNNGHSVSLPFRTIQKAASLAMPGAVIHIAPGIYRETIVPAQSGTAGAPIRYVATGQPNTVMTRGSESASTLAWMRLSGNTIGLPSSVDPANIYYADLSMWQLTDSPRFVVSLDVNRQVIARLPLAREPDWQVAVEWKYHEYWWTADGGRDVAGCDPMTDSDRYCDRSRNSTVQLTDRTTDTEPAGVEPGNLTTLSNLTGATLVALDNHSAHYLYRRAIIAHDIAAGRIMVSPPANAEERLALGWGTKYYVEDKPVLLDTPGEWWYDKVTKRLYLWPPAPGSPATQNIEITRRDVGFVLSNRSYITMDGLNFEFFNESAVVIANDGNQKSCGDTVRNAIIRYVNRGIFVDQGADGAVGNATDGFTLEDSEIAYADSRAIHLSYWWENDNAADAFTHPGITNTTIRRNKMHHLGFRSDSDNAVGALFLYADNLRFEDNYVHHVAHNGVQFSYSVVQSSKSYGFATNEIKTGGILVQDNVFEQACQLTSDCGALKFWGDPPDKHVYRDVLIAGNVFRNTFGWTSVTEKRMRWTEGRIRGMGGFGLYIDMCSGIHAYRNIAYNNSQNGYNISGVWHDGDLVYYNNVAANNLHGFYFTSSDLTPRNNVRTLFANNIIVNNEAYGVVFNDSDDLLENMSAATFDYNLYYGNGWSQDQTIWKPGDMGIYRDLYLNEYYRTLDDIRAHTPWEDHGVAGDPRFRNYDLAERNLFDGSWPDFHLVCLSTNALDRGTVVLPVSLTALLAHFKMVDERRGGVFDIGCYEHP